MDQMLESSAQKNGAARRGNPFLQPLVEISAYTKVHGVRALYAGAIPLLLRELCYISSITVANPIATKYLERTSGGGGSIVQGTAAAFSVGAMAGMVSAPFQTINAMMKSEANRGKRLPSIFREIFAPGVFDGVQGCGLGQGSAASGAGWRAASTTDTESSSRLIP
eukprot:CAMPEP_0180176382 /NCGR_PEP_ID=MMETSP0986-20121125/37257_1 /TAXON_ID=697907 /ORGANISM="non described non described, Strain CCMP2293" /LENGTH=165 /DNA_ID=CAMNT_0022128989 /DNA_START=11 /DNA_END=505 /DNA_ORIENTATION=-